MKKILGIVLFLLCISNMQAQQWIDRKYSYDSVLNVYYGSAVNFNGSSDSLFLDIYLPRCDDSAHTSKRPLMLWIHGGAFLAGNKEDASIQDLCKQFAQRGYVTASINYRLGFVADSKNRQCNFPNYPCIFAADSAEWIRAYYRAMQDGKGALRYLLNRHSQYRIDTDNVFISGESAGAITGLGVALMDTTLERPPHTYALNSVALPHSNTNACPYNSGKTFSGNSISRPDLGSIEGTIEPSAIKYTIKGIGNIYGAMYSDLLKHHKAGSAKPSIYSFHQPCDIVVPIDSGTVYWGLSWCFTNGYNCGAVAGNNVLLYGSRAISQWNTTRSYGYTIQNAFTTTNFPYSFLFGTGSCSDQINNPCHAYDNRNKRIGELVNFFAPLVSTSPVCAPSLSTQHIEKNRTIFTVYPNPAEAILHIKIAGPEAVYKIELYDITGRLLMQMTELANTLNIPLQNMNAGLYQIKISGPSGSSIQKIVIR